MILLYPINYGTTKISTLLPRVFKTLLAEPDLIQDLLPPMARRVARSTSFSQGGVQQVEEGWGCEEDKQDRQCCDRAQAREEVKNGEKKCEKKCVSCYRDI